MEPAALNRIWKRAEEIRRELLAHFTGSPPDRIDALLGEMSSFCFDEAVAEWRAQERFDDLIDYILYQYADGGGDELWEQVLLDLRQKNDEDRGHRLLEGLYRGRIRKFKSAAENFRRNPTNHFSAAQYLISKGLVMKVLYEHAFLLENKRPDTQNAKLVKVVRKRIESVRSNHSGE